MRLTETLRAREAKSRGREFVEPQKALLEGK